MSHRLMAISRDLDDDFAPVTPGGPHDDRASEVIWAGPESDGADAVLRERGRPSTGGSSHRATRLGTGSEDGVQQHMPGIGADSRYRGSGLDMVAEDDIRQQGAEMTTCSLQRQHSAGHVDRRTEIEMVSLHEEGQRTGAMGSSHLSSLESVPSAAPSEDGSSGQRQTGAWYSVPGERRASNQVLAISVSFDTRSII